jgi:tetratricopeptide (TPR) repeat protein
VDEHASNNEVNNQQGLIQAVNQGICNSPITQNFYNVHEQIWNAQICPIEDLRFESFKLGDDAAANFPYLIDPLREVYSQAIQALQEASDPVKRIKGGVLLLGESNSGKTRLALEALKQVLPEWLLLRWHPYYTSNHIPPIQALREKPLVLLLDDLHEYVSLQISSMRAMNIRYDPSLGMAPSFENPHLTALRALLETLLQATSNVVIVATCRNEYLESVNAQLGDHLLVRLRKLHLPSFNSNLEDAQVRLILEAFQREGPVHLEDWDGTIGSLVLGLSRKHDQYIALPESAQIVLRAIKLLAHAAIFAYPEQYIRKICIGIFPKAWNLQGEELWQDTMDLLFQNQFIIEDFNKTIRESNLTIRSDSYLERVISDYPPSHRPTRLEQDLSRLVEILSDLGDAEALARLAFSFSLRGLYEKALEAFDRSHTLNDNDTISWTNKGACLTQLGRIEEALQACGRAIKIGNSDIFPARINEGYCLELLNRYDEAIDSFEQILSLYPDDAYSWERKGFCLAKLGQYDKALESLDRALSLDASDLGAWYSGGFPLAVNAWRFKGFCFSMLGQHNKALEALDYALSLDVGNADTWKLRGICFIQLEQHNEAVKSYEQAIEIDPSDSSAWDSKGMCLGLAGRHEEALEAFEQALILNPEGASTWYNKAVCLEQLRQPRKALEAFEYASSLNGKDADLLYGKALCLEKLDRYDKAVRAFEQHLVLNPNDARAWDSMGADLVHVGRPLDALQAFEKALTLDPSNSEFWRHKGKCLLDELDRYREALEAYERALASDANNTSALIGKGICLVRFGRAEEALQMNEQALALDPTNLYAINNKGNCLLQLERHVEALGTFDDAITLDPDFAPAWANKVRCLQLLGRYTEAVEASRKAHLLDAAYSL